MTKKGEKINLTDSLQKLNEIATWFEDQDAVDVEAGLLKVREAAGLIKNSKSRLAEIENEFKEIEKEISEEETELDEVDVFALDIEEEDIEDIDKIPF